jgi:intermediate peptidase
MFPVVPATNWELRFGHIVGYGSMYYSYLFADVLAEDMWTRFFAGDSLARGAGEILRERLLRHGGSKDPEKLIREVLGKDSLREIGGGFCPRVS